MSSTDILSGSHIPILVKVMDMTCGDVLEVGTGLNSTPLLHWLCTYRKRRLLSLETDPRWFKSNKMFENEFHQIRLVDDWDKVNLSNRHWSVVLIDHRPALRRRIEAVRVKNNADFILLHDSEPEIRRFYGYRKILPLFKSHFQFNKLKPNTLVLSNTMDLPKLLTSI